MVEGGRERTDDEIWKAIEGFEGFYEISNLGRVKSLVNWNGHNYIKQERILAPYKQQLNKNYGRSVVKLIKNKVSKDCKVHQLVANAFIPNPNNYKIINHIGNPLNNKVDNLEWCTQGQNIKHAYDNDLRIARINTIDRETLLELLNNGYTYTQISKILGINRTTAFNYARKFKIKKIYI